MEDWIKKYLASPHQSTSLETSSHTSSNITYFDKIDLQNFTPLNILLPSPVNDESGRTPLSRRVGLHDRKNRKRPFSFLENNPETPCSSVKIKIQSPKTPRHAVKILKKVGYEDRTSYYLVQWNCGSTEDGGASTTWECGDQLTLSCRKLVKDFEEAISKDPKKAWELTDYEVEAILDRTVIGELRYLVKWVGWRVPTWEEVGYLWDYSELVEQFEKINMMDIQFWTILKNTQLRKGKEQEKNTEEPLPSNKEWALNHQKLPTTLSATAARSVKAIKVLNKLDRNKEKGSYLLLWPEEAGVRSNETPNKSWETLISLGNVEAILDFEDALKKRKGWAQQAVMYEAEKVLGRRKTSGPKAPQYLVKWRGYDEISWSDMESLQICFKHLLVAYALERPRTLKEGKMEASEIRRMNVSEKLKAEFRKINEFLKCKIGS